MIEALRRKIFEQNNCDCFIERETILNSLSDRVTSDTSVYSYAYALDELVNRLSTPIDPDDVFVGRMVEGAVPKGVKVPNRRLMSTGHMSFDYGRILRVGMEGYLREINENAQKAGDEESLLYAGISSIVINSIDKFARRWSAAARQSGKIRCADALMQVPMKPARNLFEALQCVWLLHMTASCCIGSRDYAFGKQDEYLLGYYEDFLGDGNTRDEAVFLLSGFYIKANEICGRTAHDYARKPILCNSSKQYVLIGGQRPNALSYAIFDAIEANDMAQPQLVVNLWQDNDAEFTERTFRSLSVLRDKLHIYNAPLIAKYFRGLGIARDVADNFTFSACCTVDLGWHTMRHEYYTPTVRLFCDLLGSRKFGSVDEVADALRDAVTADLQPVCDAFSEPRPIEENVHYFLMDGIFLGECPKRCRYPERGGLDYNVINCFLPGLATIGDSLAALDRMVFTGKRFTYDEFIKIVASDFKGREDTAAELASSVKFGNDTDVDRYTVLAANAMLDGVAAVRRKPGVFPVGGFYSLQRENDWADELPATPDGRRAKTPFSENQSPVYGADRSGLTALLNSLAKVPFGRTGTGGLNLTFSHSVTPEFLQSVITGYFAQGGFHAGICVLDREVLKDAMVHPERYPTLTVRLYGFSEYFISLAPWQQTAIINRTEY